MRTRSVAPADAFTAPGVTGAEPRAGITTPCAPSTSALRTIAPRLWGSVMPSSSTSSAGSPAAVAAASRSLDRRVAEAPGDRDDPLVHGARRQLRHHPARAELDRDAPLLRRLDDRLDLGRRACPSAT